MGLLTSVNNVAYELQGQKTEKEIKRREKKRLEHLKSELYLYFDTYFQENENAQNSYFQLLQDKNERIKHFKREYQESFGVKLTIENITFLISLTPSAKLAEIIARCE